MMQRQTLRDLSGRVFHGMARTTINKMDDNPMMQEMHGDFFNSDSREKVERVQNYGFTSAILPRDKQQQGGGGDSGGGSGGSGGGDSGGSGEQPKGPAAEGVAMFAGGQRNHPVIVAVDDRRHRPRGLKPGENSQYDDIGQMTLLRRNALHVLTLDSKDEKGNMVERYVSLRHVEKEKQPKPQKQAGATGKAQQQKPEEDFKHEGQSVNLEIRCTKKRIEFRSGDDVVGYYDKAAKRWAFIGDIIRLGSDDAADPVYGNHGGVGNTTPKVLVKATDPGPPTSLDAQP
jgi:phage gp45-like